VPSPIYDLFAQAIAGRKQIFCTYDDYASELCPHILGHTKGEEVALTYQFGGRSRSGLPPGGQWRCLSLSKVRNAPRRPVACRLQPHPTTALRRNRRYRRQPVEPISSAAKTIAPTPGLRCWLARVSQAPIRRKR